MMGLNMGVVSNAAAPFGGVKQSGLGREGGARGHPRVPLDQVHADPAFLVPQSGCPISGSLAVFFLDTFLITTIQRSTGVPMTTIERDVVIIGAGRVRPHRRATS